MPSRRPRMKEAMASISGPQEALGLLSIAACPAYKTGEGAVIKHSSILLVSSRVGPVSTRLFAPVLSQWIPSTVAGRAISESEFGNFPLIAESDWTVNIPNTRHLNSEIGTACTPPGSWRGGSRALTRLLVMLFAMQCAPGTSIPLRSIFAAY